jgi:hypothetical protein
MVEHDQELVADMQPSALENKLLNKLLWKNALLGALGQLWPSPNQHAVQFGPVSQRSVMQLQLPTLPPFLV